MRVIRAIALDVGTLGTGTLMGTCDFGAVTTGTAGTSIIVVDLRGAGVGTFVCDAVVELTFGDGNDACTFEISACEFVGNVIVALPDANAIWITQSDWVMIFNERYDTNNERMCVFIS